MTVVLGTLPFIATLWLLVVLASAVLEEKGAKIAAALKGESKHPSLRGQAPARLRARTNGIAPMRASVEWRAAA
jgi:hypothetical protein